eukprot:Tbor_TRINITY_DN3994_c0_g1::TRINITY_DN3994_c0_g1_i2::g.815::m.815
MHKRGIRRPKSRFPLICVLFVGCLLLVFGQLIVKWFALKALLPANHNGEKDSTNTIISKPGLTHHTNFHSSNGSYMLSVTLDNGEQRQVPLKCPIIDIEDLNRRLQIPLKHLPRKKKTSVSQKYDRRANNCAKNGVWHRVTIDDHHKILHNIVKISGIKRGETVFDWGSGCGHSMNFLYNEYNVTGVGIDVSSKTIEYAIRNTTSKNLYCVADGTQLEWIPNNSFDHVISFGSIYHVYNSVTFCSVLRQLVRIVKKGGTVYNGWTEDEEFKRDYVGLCLSDLERKSDNSFGTLVKHTIVEEKDGFSNVRLFPLKAHQETPNTYSLRIDKLRETTQGEETGVFDVKGVPIVCAASGSCELIHHTTEDNIHVNVISVKSGDGDQKGNAGHVTKSSKESQLISGVSFDGWPTCPAYDATIATRLAIPLKHLPRKKKTTVSQKYDRRAHNCARNGIWHRVTIDDHAKILEIIGNLIHAKKGQVLFDWGSGCGHQLEFMYSKFGARGLGIDVSTKTVAYAIKNTTNVNRFCVADGSKLDWIPDNTFDGSYSFGSILHVYNTDIFCSVLNQLVRITKVGGFIYSGWTDNKEFNRNDVRKCLATGSVHQDNNTKGERNFKSNIEHPSPHTFEIFKEVDLFKHVAHFPLKAGIKTMAKSNSYSLLIKKGSM